MCLFVYRFVSRLGANEESSMTDSGTVQGRNLHMSGSLEPKPNSLQGAQTTLQP